MDKLRKQLEALPIIGGLIVVLFYIFGWRDK